VVLADAPHHVTQRRVNRQAVFFSDADRRVYLELIQHSAASVPNAPLSSIKKV
jgi:hypothetical protein